MADPHRARSNLLEYLRRLVPKGQWALACDLYRQAIEEAKAEAVAEAAEPAPAAP